MDVREKEQKKKRSNIKNKSKKKKKSRLSKTVARSFLCFTQGDQELLILHLQIKRIVWLISICWANSALLKRKARFIFQKISYYRI